MILLADRPPLVHGDTKMSKPRPATLAQAYRLNSLGCFKLVEPGEAEVVDWHQADKILSDAAAAGLWTPAKSSDRYPRDTNGDRTTDG